MRAPVKCVVQVMSMCGTGGEENTTDAFGDATEQVSQPVMSLSSPGLNEATSCTHSLSPLSTLLSCRNIAPIILEHEKAFLVIKEHDYAKAPDRPELLQLSALLVSEEERTAALATPYDASGVQPELTSLSRKAMKDMLLNCPGDVLGLRGRFAQAQDGTTCRQLREVVSLQVSLIREQQEQLHQKDRDLSAARKEKEQLEARLERMERRLAILQKHSRNRHAAADSDTHPPSSSSPSVVTPRIRRSRAEMVAMSERHNRSRSSSVDTSRTRSRASSHSGTPVPPDEGDCGGGVKRAAKKRVRPDLDDGVSMKKSRRSSVQLKEIRTKLEYSKLQLPGPSSLGSANALLDIQCNHICEPSSQVTSRFISVPSWCVGVDQSAPDSLVSDDPMECEDLTDDAFLKRHKKPEEDEKRRKRWDIQRARSLREHEELLRKYKLKGASGQGQKERKAKEKVATFESKLYEVEAIEVMDTVAVNAFGRPLPLMEPSEFELPWFDLDARDTRESFRTTRSKAKARQSIGSSSTEEL